MKKVYQKPELFYENFALSASIASCDVNSNFNQATGCQAYWNEDFNGWVFSSDAEGCNLHTIKDGSECYGNPTPGYSIFTS